MDIKDTKLGQDDIIAAMVDIKFIARTLGQDDNSKAVIDRLGELSGMCQELSMKLQRARKMPWDS